MVHRVSAGCQKIILGLDDAMRYQRFFPLEDHNLPCLQISPVTTANGKDISRSHRGHHTGAGDLEANLTKTARHFGHKLTG
jgi:hypothetical protein